MSYGLKLTKRGGKGYVSVMTIKRQCQESQNTKYKDIILKGYPKATPMAPFLLHLECRTKILKVHAHLTSHMFGPTPFILPFCRPPRWHCTILPLSWPSIAREKVYFKKWSQVFKKIFAFIHEVSPIQCFLTFFDSFQFQLFIDSYIFPLVCKSILKNR